MPDDYTDEIIARRLMVGPHGLIVHTARNTTVPVCVERHQRRPEPDCGAFQHVVEAGFTYPTGRLVLAGLMDDSAAASRLPVRAAAIGALASFVGLDTLDEFGLEGDDRYPVQLWPAAEPGGVHKAWPLP